MAILARGRTPRRPVPPVTSYDRVRPATRPTRVDRATGPHDTRPSAASTVNREHFFQGSVSGTNQHLE